MRRFENKEGKVIYFGIENVRIIQNNYPEGTLELSISLYPVGSGRYSSFIYTTEPTSKIESCLERIAEEFLNDNKSSYSTREISKILSKFVSPIFPVVAD